MFCQRFRGINIHSPGSEFEISAKLVTVNLRDKNEKNNRVSLTSRSRLRVRPKVQFSVSMEVVCLLSEVVVLQMLPREPVNIPSLCAVEVYHAPQRVCENDAAPENMPCMVVTLDTSHEAISPLNDDAEKNMPNMVVTLDTSHLEMSPLNDDAELNVSSILITLDTSHLEMSPLNDDAESNMLFMSVTLDTSHLEMSLLNDDAW